MSEVLFQDGEFGGRSCGRGDLVVFLATVLDDYLETFNHRVGRAQRRGQLQSARASTPLHISATTNILPVALSYGCWNARIGTTKTRLKGWRT